MRVNEPVRSVEPVDNQSHEHAFIVPAYGESPYLEACLQSLLAQSPASSILVTTSTPSRFLTRMCEANGIALRVNPHARGIGADWNFALAQSSAPFVTLAHQDDIYHPDFKTESLAAFRRHPPALMCLTDSEDIVDGERRHWTKLLAVKRVLMETAFLGRQYISHTRTKRRLLRFGCPICCPSVTFNMAPIGPFAFRTDMKVALDWEAWVRLASRDGGFVLLRRPLVAHRVHVGAETAIAKRDGVRQSEDRYMFGQLWPPPFDRIMTALYRLGL